MTGMYEGYINSIVLDIREKTSSFNKEKTWLDLCREQSLCNLRTDLKSDICAYIRMSSIHEWTHTSHA
jgi:hypothetical protein